MAEKARRSGFTLFTTQFTCFTSTKAQILTPEEARRVAILAREEREAERRRGGGQRSGRGAQCAGAAQLKTTARVYMYIHI